MNNTNTSIIYPHEYEQASNSYLMSVIAILAGLPLPIINFIATVMFYLGSRKSTYFVRWHCIQSIIAQALLIPFNSIAFAWTLGLIINYERNGQHHPESFLSAITGFYWAYIIFILFLNLFEFITVLYTASQVRKGNNIRWAVIAAMADRLTSKENRDIYAKNA